MHLTMCEYMQYSWTWAPIKILKNSTQASTKCHPPITKHRNTEKISSLKSFGKSTLREKHMTACSQWVKGWYQAVTSQAKRADSEPYSAQKYEIKNLRNFQPALPHYTFRYTAVALSLGAHEHRFVQVFRLEKQTAAKCSSIYELKKCRTTCSQ